MWATSFPYPTRLVIMLSQPQEAGRGLSITLSGGNNEDRIQETFSREDFHWSQGARHATSRQLYSFFESMQVEGLEKNNRVVLKVMDFSRKDITQFLPVWAGIPALNRVEKMLTKNIKEGKRFRGVFGIPYEPGYADKRNAVSRWYVPAFKCHACRRAGILRQARRGSTFDGRNDGSGGKQPQTA